VAKERALKLLHSSHTSSGITPARINQPNMMQPKHTANADSKNAAPTRPAITTRAAVSAPDNINTDATIENVAPTP
jgi:hypothetical protein